MNRSFNLPVFQWPVCKPWICLRNLGLPVDFFDMTPVGIAHTLRLWILQEVLEIHILDLHASYKSMYSTLDNVLPWGLFKCYRSTYLSEQNWELNKRWFAIPFILYLFFFASAGKLKCELVACVSACMCACIWSIMVNKLGAVRFLMLAGQPLQATEMFVLGSTQAFPKRLC